MEWYAQRLLETYFKGIKNEKNILPLDHDRKGTENNQPNSIRPEKSHTELEKQN